MQKLFYIFATLVLAGCTVSGIGDDTVELRSEGAVYTAGFEQVGTKVYVDTDLKSHWTADDRISIFASTNNEAYRFDGLTGDKSGTFTRVGTGNGEGSELPTSYAVYPFSDGTSISAEGEITVSLPAVQSYAENSYGLGANTMVAVAESKTSTDLFFRNVCGYVVVKLFGEGSVKSISITGNNNEKIAGQATVKAEFGQAPVASLSESATTSITLDCGEGVELGKTADEAIAFWFAVPPVTFSQGFTIRVTSTDLWSMEKAMTVERTVTRNIKNPLSPLEANFNIPPEGNIEFEDANFKAYCVENFDTDGDGEISYTEGLAIKEVNVSTNNIASLVGVEFFRNLEVLTCHSNGYGVDGVGTGLLKSLDVSKNAALTHLNCSMNQLTSLDVSNNTALTDLQCAYNPLNSLDVSNNTALTDLHCGYNRLTSLDVSKNAALTYLSCYDNQLSLLDVSQNTALTTLYCYYNQLTSLDISKNTGLISLECDANQLISLNVSNNTALTRLSCNRNPLTSLDVSNNTSLTTLYCCYTQLNTLDVSKNTALEQLCCYDMPLTSLDVSNNTALKRLECQNVPLSSLDVSNNTALNRLVLYGTLLSALDVSNNTKLTRLWCYNSQLTSLDVSNNTALEDLVCSNNQLTSLIIGDNTVLKAILCEYNQLTELDLSKNTALNEIRCRSNQLTSLNVGSSTVLTKLSCECNKLTSLDVSKNTALTQLKCYDNQLTVLDVSNNLALNYLECYINPDLTEIWLKTGQTIPYFYYDPNISTVYYK